MSSAFQLSATYWPTTSVTNHHRAGNADKDHGDQNLARPVARERGRVANQQCLQRPAPNRRLEHCQEWSRQQDEAYDPQTRVETRPGSRPPRTRCRRRLQPGDDLDLGLS
jgi:hypothetical protein